MNAGPDTGGDRDGVAVRPEELTTTTARDWVIRFAFGAGVSAVAGVVSAVAGPKVGGLFLAFPAILLASLTLVAQEGGRRHACDDARGATFGTLGLLAFAVGVAVFTAKAAMWIVLGAASAAWLVVALGAYFAGHHHYRYRNRAGDDRAR
jgi:uncharacterized membrane protein (GlpM family)